MDTNQSISSSIIYNDVMEPPRRVWVGQSTEHLTLDFSSGHDFRVREMEPRMGLCTDSAEPAWDSLSVSLCPLPLSLKINELKKKFT